MCAHAVNEICDHQSVGRRCFVQPVKQPVGKQCFLEDSGEARLSSMMQSTN